MDSITDWYINTSTVLNTSSSNPLDTSWDEETADVKPAKLVSEAFSAVYIETVYFILMPICALGVITNVINLRIFTKQGLNDSTNVALFSLSLAEMMGCLLLLPNSFCWFLQQSRPKPDFFTCLAFVQMPFGYSHIICSRIATWVTVYLSLERTLCVVMPMKVKSLIYPRRSKVANVCIWVSIILLHVPYATRTRIAWMFHPLLNATIAATLTYQHHDMFQTVTVFIGTTIMSTLAICIVLVSTVLMIHKLKQARRWRETTSTATAPSSRDVDVLKTVILVTSIYLVCLSMSHIPSSFIISLPGVTINGYNSNTFNLVVCTRFLFTAINATSNFFGYVLVSSKYKKTFVEIFPVCSQNIHKK